MTTPNFSRADRDYIIEELRQRVLEVDFVKADGSTRTLKCTLKADLLPKPDKPLIDTLKKPKTENLEVIAAWDIENKGWRSFRLDSIKSITIQNKLGAYTLHSGDAV